MEVLNRVGGIGSETNCAVMEIDEMVALYRVD